MRDTGRQYSIDQKILASLVGVFAIGLPVGLAISGFADWTCFYNSVSHFYYGQLVGDIFVGILIFIFCFLFAYRGESWWETRLATIAGFASAGVAFLPTSGRGCEDPTQYPGRILVELKSVGSDNDVEIAANSDYFSLFPYVEVLHYLAAASLFIILAIFCFWVFPRTFSEGQERSRHYEDTGELRLQKVWRNRLYRAAGLVIVFCMIGLGVGFFVTSDVWTQANVTFWLEAFALVAFGVAWLVKGRFFGRLLLDPGE